MSEPPPPLSTTEFESVFPFYLALSPDLRVSRFGQLLGRVLPELREGDNFTQHFELKRPRVDELSFADLSQHSRSVVLLQALACPMLLRGQIKIVDEGSTALFLGSPWVTKWEQLDALGLRSSDFAVHDPLADMLVLLHTQRSALEDSQALTRALSEQRAALQRTASTLEGKLAQIEEQRDLIQALSTPVIKVWEEVVVLPLVGALDEERAEQLMSAALDAVAEGRARHVIIDVTGTTDFGSDIVGHLGRTACGLGLLGARCVLVGISPKLAAQLTVADSGLEGIATFATLQAGLRDALASRSAGKSSSPHRA